MSETNGYPGPAARTFVGFTGSTLSVAPPIWTWFYVGFLNGPVREGAQAVTTGTVIVLGMAWLISFFLTAYMKEDHILKCVLTSIGLPGVVVSLALGLQSIN